MQNNQTNHQGDLRKIRHVKLLNKKQNPLSYMIVNYRKIQETKSLMHLDLANRVRGFSNGAKDATTMTIFLQWSFSTWFHFSEIVWIEE